MTKSIADRLSGEVRMLEHNIAGQKDRIASLTRKRDAARAERDELREENAILEYDNREAWARLASWKDVADQACDSAGALEEERAQLIIGKLKAERHADALDAEVTEANARAEVAEQNARNWEHQARQLGAFARKNPTAVPRAIRPDEVEVGQVVALWGHEDGTERLISACGTVEEINDGNLFTPGDMWADFAEDWKQGRVTIDLLAEAPEDADEGEGPSGTASRAWQIYLRNLGHYQEGDDA